jgi:hypothetical protein
MVFPGVLRGRPGPRLATIHTSRPRRSLSSPWMLCCPQCSRVRHTKPGPAHKRKRRGPGPLEEPFPTDPEALRFGWRGLTPRWPRSLRLGSASSFNVARSPTDCNPFASSSPHLAKKSSRPPFDPARLSSARVRSVPPSLARTLPSAPPSALRSAPPSPCHPPCHPRRAAPPSAPPPGAPWAGVVRQRLSVLPQ